MAEKKSRSGRMKKANPHSKAEPALKKQIKKISHAEKIIRTLFHIANAVNTSHDLDELYATIHKTLSDVIDVTNFFIASYDKKSDVITFPFQRDEKDKIEDYGGGIIRKASQSNSLTARVINSGRPCFFKKKQIIEVYRKSNEFGSISEQWLGVPLRVKEEIIGVLVVLSYRNQARYNQQDADLLLAVSDQIALAIELKRALDIIKENEKRYRTLVEKTNDVVFSIDAEGYFKEISPAIENITGYSREEIIGSPPSNGAFAIKTKETKGWYRKALARKSCLGLEYEHLIHPDDRQWASIRINEAVEKGLAYHLDYRLIKKNGRLHWISERGVVYENEAGQKQIEGMIQDIHKRKYAEDINQVLFSISNAVNVSPDLEALYQSIHRSLSRIIDTTNFWISLYHEEKDSLSFDYVKVTVDDPAFSKELLNLSDPDAPIRTSEVIRTGKPVLRTKADYLKKLEKLNRPAALTISEIWLGVPLKIQGKVIGVMSVQSFDNPNLYDEKDADILMSVSDQIALAIEHKKAAEALILEKARLEHLFADSREAIAMTDNQGRILRVNQAFTTLFGYDPREVLNQSIDDLITSQELRKEAKSYTLLLSQGKSSSAEVIRYTKDHKRLQVIATGIPIFADGTVLGIYCIYQNITEQRRAENIQSVLYEIAKAVNSTQSLGEFFKIIHQSLGRIIDTTNFFIALYDHEKEFIHFVYYVDEKDNLVPEIPINHSASLTARVIRLKKSQLLIEREIQEFYQQSHDEPVGSIAKLWMGVPLLIRNEIIGAVVVQSYTDPFRYTEDDIRILESVSEQIAIAIDSKRTRDALEESEKRYRTVFDGTEDAIFVHDMGNRFLDVNKLACERYGYSREELLQMGPKDITTHKQVELIHKRVAQILKTGHYLSEGFHINKDGTLIPVELSSKIIEYLGKQAVLSVAHDISERKKAEEEKKKLEEQLRQAQKMEAIGTLAGGIAHDFNNILSPIIGYTELSLYQLQQDDKAHKNMREVLKAAERAKNLVKQILTFSRQSEQESKPIKVGPIIGEIAKLLQATLPSFIQIVLRISEEQGAIMADPTQIHQVLMNLGTNAYHAMRSKGGILEISLSEVVLAMEDRVNHHNLMPGPYLKLSVSDTGHGISPMIINKIFDPYFTTKDPGEGTGMGLAVVHGIIKSYKGDINIYSELGIGTTFHIYLPEIMSDAVFQQAQAVHRAPGGNERILLVDDEEPIIDMMQQMLLALGYQVTARTSSIEALEAFKAQPKRFDLVITDQTMPNMSGAELSQKLLKIRKEIPIILCTGFSEVVTEAQAKAIGIREYVMKPIIKNEIATVIRRTLDKVPHEKNE